MKKTEELLDILEKEKDAFVVNGSQQEAFLNDIGAKHSDTDYVTASIIYWTYLQWKEFREETDIIDRSLFFRRTHGFPGRFKKKVRYGETIYRMNKDVFPEDTIHLRIEMRKLWREEKEVKQAGKTKRKRD